MIDNIIRVGGMDIIRQRKFLKDRKMSGFLLVIDCQKICKVC